MSSKNYGPAVSGYLDPSARNWETAVFQAGKPVLDKELNLQQDIDAGYGQAAVRRQMPSGWVSDDFVKSSDMAAAIFTPSLVSYELAIPNGLVAHVNGWLLNVSYTGQTTYNSLILSEAPLGLGVKRTDLVILEVWRRLLSASTPDGKSPTQRIWRGGNVKITTDVAPYTFDSDILDTNVGAETTKRVQIQYRLRVVQGVDLSAHPYGMDDPSVVAYTVPPDAAHPDGTPTAYLFANQSANGDAGLWVAGDGTVAAQTTLGTVDGFMYAIPLCAVVRRNQTPFDKNTNHNGGASSGGASDRPDGLFYDLFAARDIIDLRNGVCPTGWSFEELTHRNLGYLLDNNLRTEWMTTAKGGGYFGHTVLNAAEIGVLPGDGVLTGDTPGADFIGQFDCCRRTFSDRPVVEVVTVPLSRLGGGNWVAGDTVTIDPTALPVYGYAAFNFASRNPPNVMMLDITEARFVGEAAGKWTTDAMPAIAIVTNLGTNPLLPVQVTLGPIPANVTDERLFVSLLVSWPAGFGLPMTPTATYTLQVNNPLVLPAGSTVFSGTDLPHREVRLTFTQNAQTITQIAENVVNSTLILLPERALSVSTILKNGNPVVGAFTLDPNQGGVRVTLAADSTQPGDQLTITYVPLRPLPQGSVQVTVWYETRSPQTAREALIGTTLTVIPRHISTDLHLLTVGSGSPDTAYPYPTAYVQLGGIFPTSVGTFEGDHELAAEAPTYTATFNASTGYLKLPTYLGYVPNPQEAVFSRLAGDVDVEGRSYFPTVSASTYIPAAYAQTLTDPKRHRNFLPMIAELATDSPLGFKGQLVLVMLLREALFDKQNEVAFNLEATANTTVATVYRIKGNLLDKLA